MSDELEIEWRYYADDGWQATVDGEPSVFWIAKPYTADGDIWVLKAGTDVTLCGSTDVEWLKEKVWRIEKELSGATLRDSKEVKVPQDDDCCLDTVEKLEDELVRLYARMGRCAHARVEMLAHEVDEPPLGKGLAWSPICRDCGADVPMAAE